MDKPTLTLAAALLLGGASFATAQRDGGLPAPGGQRGPAMEAPGGGGGGGRSEGLMRKSEGPNPAVRDGAPAGEAQPAAREDTPGPRDTSADEAQGSPGKKAAEPAGKEAPRANKQAEQSKSKTKADGSGPKSTVQDKAAEVKEPARNKKAARDMDAGGGKDATADGGKAGEDKADQARGESSKSDRAAKRDGASKDGPDSAETERAKPDDRAKQAQGDRKSPDEAKKADLSGERKERVRSAFREGRGVKRRKDVDIDIVVGARLPTAWDYAPVPVLVVETVPEYRGYVYTYVEDEYVIADPVTYEVVAVLPADGGPAYAGGGGGAGVCSETLALTEDERALIVKSIQIVDEVEAANVTVGWTVPSDIELKAFPQPIVERSGKLEPCRYFVVDDQIAIVDPEEDTVVLLVEHDE
jgi:hypothetical protein